MDINYNLLKIKSSDGKHIDNVKEFIDYLNSIDTLSDDLINYLNYVIDKLKDFELVNKEELISVITHRIESSKGIVNSDKQALEQVVELNTDFKNLNVIVTSKEYNDSKKDVEYITFKKDNGDVEVLFVQYQNKLQEYIDNNIDRIADLTAEEVFNFLKENVNRDVKFYNIDEAITTPGMLNEPVVSDEEIIMTEKKEINEYMKQHDLDADIMVAVDYYGERIYKVNDFVCKFSFIEGERRMQIIRDTDLALKNEEEAKGENVETVEQTKEEDIQIETDATDDFEETKVETKPTYDSLPLVATTSENYYLVKNLLDKQILNAYSLTDEENLFVMSYFKSVIVAMGNYELSETLTNDELLLIDNYISSINVVSIVKIDDENNNELDSEIELGNPDIKMTEPSIEEELINHYYENKKILSMNKEEQQKVVLTKPEEIKRAGVADTVIVLELGIIAMYILGFIYYVK